MSKIKNENHIVIHGWMINELNLKSNELIIYAFIYGVTQDGESEFYGSRNYLASCCNASLPTVDNALSSLVEKNLIIKRQEKINGVIFNRYKVNYDSLETLWGVKNLYGGSKETLHNNKYNKKEKEINNNKLLFKKKDAKTEEIKEIVDYLNQPDTNEPVRTFKYTSKNTKTLISARLKEGFTVDEFKDVIFYKYNEWVEKPFKFSNGVMSDTYYRPETLFNSKNFENYLQEYNESIK